MKTRATLLIAFVALTSGCQGTAGTSTPPEPLRIAAASDLQAVMPRLIERFREAHGVEVIATFGASGQLSQQIKQGAPFDVFLAANRKFVADLADAGVIDPATVQDYAVGSLVLVVGDEVAAKIETLDDLKSPAIKKIASANPETAPYGAAAKQVLEKSGLWGELEPKRVQAETVRQALQFVQTGNAEAGLVGKAIAGVKGVRVVAVDDALHEPLIQTMGILAESKKRKDALAFQWFIAEGNDARQILRDAGFRVEARKDRPAP